MSDPQSSMIGTLVSLSSIVDSPGMLPDGTPSFSSEGAASADALKLYASHLEQVVARQFEVMSEIGPLAGICSVLDQLTTIVKALGDDEGWRSLVDAGSTAFAKERLLGIMTQCNVGIEAIKTAERDAKDDAIAKLEAQVLKLTEERDDLSAAKEEAEAEANQKQVLLNAAETELQGFRDLVGKFVADAGTMTQTGSKKRKKT